MGYQRRLGEASGRLEALLGSIPGLESADTDDKLPENEDAQ
jgi:hypothetical protein